jgi:pimeloyl-ACP methyl ester carboxylesterase
VASDLLSALVIPASKVVVVGHSMGAMVASELALFLPLRGVVLLGPVHPTPALAKIFDERIQKVQKGMIQGLSVCACTC